MGLVQSIAALFSRSSKPSSSSDPRHVLGRRGERLAEKFLRRQRHKILRRNFRPRHGGEVDLVCRDLVENELVFVEVKTRTTDDFGRPADAVTLEKQELIARGARAWLKLLARPDVVFRFDIVEVVIGIGEPVITQIKSAFILPEERRKEWIGPGS
jgi:putative endonuclease